MAGLAESLPALDLLELESRTDSAFVWALLRARARDGVAMADAVRSVVHDIRAVTGARLNLLLTDGATVVAAVDNEPLSTLTGDGFLVVASEPFDDSPDWQDVAEGVHTWKVEGAVEDR